MATDSPYPPPPPPARGGFTPLLPTPPTDAPWPRPPRRNRQWRAIGIGSAVFVLVAGGVGAALFAFVSLRGTGDVLSKLTPNTSAFYLSIYLDPPSSQKSNFNNLLHKFPDVKDDQQRDKKINDVIDQALKRSHLNHDDVKSWLGSQVAVVAPVDLLNLGGTSSRASARAASVPVDPAGMGADVTADTSTSASQFAILVSSTDDKKAQATLTSFRNNDDGKSFTWNDDTHDGVTVSRGTPSSGGSMLVYGVVDHAVVFSSSQEYMNDIIDTAHGKRSSLDASDTFKKAVAGLPADHLALAYVDMGAVAGKLKDTLRNSGRSAQNQAGLAQLDALRGFAITLSAQQTGFALDGNAYLDTSKLTDQQRQLLNAKAEPNRTTDSIPSAAYGFLSFGGADKAVQSLSDALGQLDPSVKQELDKLGLTGPNGIASHLTGDAGVEVGPRADSKVPGGTLLLATNDEASMSRFLGNVADVAAVGTSASGSSSGASSSTLPAPAPEPSTAVPGYPAPPLANPGLPLPPRSGAGRPVRPLPGYPAQAAGTTQPPVGVQLAELPTVPSPSFSPGPKVGRPPARAPAGDPAVVHVKVMYHGVEITTAGTLASDPHGVLPSYAVSRGMGILGTSVDDVKAVIDAQSGANIASAGAYKDAIAQAPKGSNGALFLNIPAVVSAVRAGLPSSDRDTFDRTAAADIAPLKSLIVTGQSSGDHASVRMFLTIG